MNTKCVTFITMIVSILVLGGCAAKVSRPFSSEEREVLSTVSLIPVEVEHDAYEEPDITDNLNNGPIIIPISTGYGVMPIVVGSEVLGVLSSEERKYKNQNSHHYKTLESAIPSFAERVDKIFGEAFKSNSFFSNRVIENSENKFHFVVTAYGFVRSYEMKDDVGLKFYLDVDIRLRTQFGKKYSYGVMFGESSDIYTIKEFAETPSLIDEAVNQAIKEVAGHMDRFLQFKTAEVNYDE